MNNANRTITSRRSFRLSSERMFAAWTDPDELKLWWGPKDFTNTFQEFDLRPGGTWKYIMHGPDGTDYPNESSFAEIVPNERIVFDHLSGHRFRTTVLFTVQEMVTTVDWSMEFESADEFEKINSFIAAANEQNLDRLEAHLSGEPFVIERTLNAPASLVWKAITQKDLMKEWYFDLEEFKPEIGFSFQFSGGPPEREYLHLCEITEVIPEKRLSYSWRYKGYEGISFVTFELIPSENRTIVRLTHAGLGTFPKSNPDLAKKNFEAGWTDIIGRSLKEFAEKK